MTTQTQISAVIIAYNEEKQILRCLESVKAIADEIIVVDSFSTDDTPEICKQFGVNVYQHKFSGHIEQKNYAASLAKHPYILSLDADEVLSESLKEFILSIKPRLSDYDAYSFKRLNNYCGKWIKNGGWYPDRKIRLWQAGKGKWGGDNPHDKIIMNEHAKIKIVHEDILHYSFHSISSHLQQIDKFSEIAAETAFKKGKKSSYLHIVFSPLFKFFRDYFFKTGFLDGYYGLVIAANSAHSKFLKYAKLYEKQHIQKSDK